MVVHLGAINELDVVKPEQQRGNNPSLSALQAARANGLNLKFRHRSIFSLQLSL